MRSLFERAVISLDFMRSELNLADPLTKILNRKLVKQTSKGMRLLLITKVKGDGSLTC